MLKVDSIDGMIADMKSGIWDFTENGKCSGCGSCCSNVLPMSEKEVRRIKEYIKIHGIKAQKRLIPTAKPTVDLVCPFRNNTEKKCEIYEVRPEICRDFRCDKPKKGIWASGDLYKDEIILVLVRETFFGE